MMNKREMRFQLNQGLAPEDYYRNEQGYIVFTATYHLKRGYCCRSGCKHCPYGFQPDRPGNCSQPPGN